MLRITSQDDVDSLRLQLEGQLNGPWVAELAGACEPALGIGRMVVLDLAEVTFLDHAGARLLVRLARRGVELREPSAFVWEQLRQHDPAGELTGPMSSG